MEESGSIFDRLDSAKGRHTDAQLEDQFLGTGKEGGTGVQGLCAESRSNLHFRIKRLGLGLKQIATIAEDPEPDLHEEKKRKGSYLGTKTP